MAIDQIKLHVSNDVKLQFYDCSKPLYIEVDMSNKGIGAVMLQQDSIVPNSTKSDDIPTNLRLISYASKTLHNRVKLLKHRMGTFRSIVCHDPF